MSERESFDAMVNRVAADALFKLIRGHQWESIVHQLAVQVIMWRKNEDKAQQEATNGQE